MSLPVRGFKQLTLGLQRKSKVPNKKLKTIFNGLKKVFVIVNAVISYLAIVYKAPYHGCNRKM